ncbi:hypothetical protein D3C73_1423930 [compost metagenome]
MPCLLHNDTDPAGIYIFRLELSLLKCHPINQIVPLQSNKLNTDAVHNRRKGDRQEIPEELIFVVILHWPGLLYFFLPMPGWCIKNEYYAPDKQRFSYHP